MPVEIFLDMFALAFDREQSLPDVDFVPSPTNNRMQTHVLKYASMLPQPVAPVVC